MRTHQHPHAGIARRVGNFPEGAGERLPHLPPLFRRGGGGLIDEVRLGTKEADEEEQDADEKVEPEGRHLRRALAAVEIGGELAGLEQKGDDVAEQFRVEMEEILQGIEEHMRERPVELEIMLAALRTERSRQPGAAIFAVGVPGPAMAGGLFRSAFVQAIGVTPSVPTPASR